jgi:hypothetical protein
VNLSVRGQAGAEPQLIVKMQCNNERQLVADTGQRVIGSWIHRRPAVAAG